MLLVLCLLYLIVWVGNCNEKKVYVMHGNWAHSFGYSARLNFSIGTPEQSFIGVLCPHFTNLLVVDSDCGKQSKKCPRYCRDENFMEMFCSTLCQQITQQNRPTYCINALTDEEPRVYNHQKSLTYKKSSKSTEWSTYYEKTRKLSGDYVKDRIVFRSLDGRTLLIDEMEFVSGMMLDHLLFYSQDSVIGIAPGNKTNPSFFLQLYNRKLIEQPVLSIASKDIAFQTLTIGGIDNKNCANWQEFDVLEDQAYGWIIEVDSFTILSHEFKRKTRILWDIMSSLPLFPLFAMDILVKEANFHKRISDYDADCSVGNFKLTFTQGEHSIEINKTHLVYDCPKCSGNCAVYVDAMRKYRSILEPEWIFGSNFIQTVCHAYDFQRKKLFIGTFVNNTLV